MSLLDDLKLDREQRLTRVPVPDTVVGTDPVVPDEGDADGQAAPEPEEEEEPLPPMQGGAQRKPPAFGRVLRYHRFGAADKGRDVLAVSRALHLHGYRWSEPTDTYGWRMRDNVELFQRRHNQKDDGVYDAPVHAYLAEMFDPYSDWLYRNAEQRPVKPDASPRDRLMRAVWYLYAKRPWTYHAVRPFLLYNYEQKLRYAFDCSWFAKQVYFLARLPSPDGGYAGGNGNTETLRAHGRHVSVPNPGDLAFYGYYGSSSNPAHVCVCVANQKTIGFGSSGGPRLLDLHYRTLREVRAYV